MRELGQATWVKHGHPKRVAPGNVMDYNLRFISWWVSFEKRPHGWLAFFGRVAFFFGSWFQRDHYLGGSPKKDT